MSENIFHSKLHARIQPLLSSVGIDAVDGCAFIGVREPDVKEGVTLPEVPLKMSLLDGLRR